MEDEFFLYMPASFVVGGSSNYYLTGDKGEKKAIVERRATAARYINRLLLVFDAFDGDTKGIEEIMYKAHSGLNQFGETVTRGKFTIREFRGMQRTRHVRIQYLNNGKRLYKVMAISPDEAPVIVKGFFDSVHVFVDGKSIAVNAASDASTLRLPKLVEEPPILLDDSQPVELDKVDRPPFILFIDRVSFESDNRRHISGGEIEVKVLLSSTGKVTKTEIVKNNFPRMSKEVVVRAESTIFIPAEKDGKLVSVYSTLNSSFGFVN